MRSLAAFAVVVMLGILPSFAEDKKQGTEGGGKSPFRAGTYFYKPNDSTVVSFTFKKGNRMRWEMYGRIDGKVYEAFDATYALTDDNVLFGVVTSVEGEGKGAAELKKILDEPFSFRYRLDEEKGDGQVLTVKGLKLAAPDRKREADEGRYQWERK